ncbi:Peptidase E [Austwickia sp. TVS 96-490-7B]|uniref:Type 1 glutamine amidotransferase-like domain-containing protein n=1 Tax=Austwickia sp. TVS 96-490-7B TaxID=2830843 RepID=UPI001C562C8A|nr:peptidase E [Austwickia sp. TVS 96-490-7B]MBW3084935.1 Peptidase E [Austwickia sp. TVS 96-490-7B]
MAALRTIVLLGGGFYDQEHVQLDDFLIESTPVARPRICFIPTASGDSKGYIERFYDGLAKSGCPLSHLDLFNRTVANLAAYLAAQDIVYVGGGNTANMLAVWRLHGLDAAPRQAYLEETVLAGISAGAACWFESSLSDSFGRVGPLRDGLGLLPGSFCPHYNTEPERPEAYRHSRSARGAAENSQTSPLGTLQCLTFPINELWALFTRC